MNAVNQAQMVDEIQRRLEEGVTREDPHPINVDGLELCVLVASLNASKNVHCSQFGGIEQKKLRKVLVTLGIDDFGIGQKATKNRIAKKIQDYVTENCGCVVPEI